MDDLTKDDRFKEVSFDPKFARKAKKNTRVKVDKRFQRMFTDNDFGEVTGKVDRFGRKVNKSKKINDLKRLYDMEESEEEEDSAKKTSKKKEQRSRNGKGDRSEADDANRTQSRLDYLNRLARGEIEGSSSSDEDEESESKKKVKRKMKKKENEPAKTAAKKTTRKMPQLESEEESEGESSSGSDLDAEEDMEEEGAAKNAEEEEDIPTGDATRRIAVQNLDWSKMTATDIFAVLQSFVPLGGSLVSVAVYLSQFGEDRLKEEESFGPRIEPAEEDDEEDNDSDEESNPVIVMNSTAGEGEGFNTEALRKYERSKLRYYFAVAEFDNVETANKVYEQCDGVEYERSSVVFDLRFIPDEVEIDRPLREKSNGVSDDYEAPDFVNMALQNTNVNLTWDEDDFSRKKIKEWKNGALVKGKRMIGERDLEAFIASDIESDDDESDEETQKLKSDEYRKSLRAALLGDSGSNDTEKPGSKLKQALLKAEADEEDEDDFGTSMEMTYVPAADKKSKLNSKKQKEQKSKPSKSLKAKEEGEDDEEKEADVLNDPFFADESKSKKKKKKNASKSRHDDDEEDEEERPMSEEQRRKREEAELELLLLNEKGRAKSKGLEGFDYKSLEMGEKLLKSGKKIKGHGKRKERMKNALEAAKQDTFEVDTKDDRFAAFYNDPEFSVDRTNSHYKPTKGMVEFEKEQLKNRSIQKEKRVGRYIDSSNNAADGNDMDTMVKSIKLKSQLLNDKKKSRENDSEAMSKKKRKF